MNHDLKRRSGPIALLALVALTAAALLWNQFGMNTRLVLDASTALPVRAIDDSSSGGKTTSSIRRDGHALAMDCDIRAGYAWPYCTMVFELGRPPRGLDLSGFDAVRVRAGAMGPEPSQQLRLFLLDHNPAYSRTSQPDSAKVQELVYDPVSHRELSVQLRQFTVSSWWSTAHPVGVEHAGTEFDNVVAFQIATGGAVVPGHHVITVDQIEFTGKLVPAATFRLWIIGLWIAGGFVYLLKYALDVRRSLLATRFGKAALEQLNDELRQEAAQLHGMARRDPLTGALNRFGLRDELSKAAGRGDARFFPLSIVFVDIDHFKKINDTHGHDVGDQVIREISDVIHAAVQRDDICARWGGEEFLLIFPGTPATDARAIAERLRRAMSRHAWPGGMQVTGSFGIAQAAAGEDLVDGIKRADEAMYLAKSNGRNRVEVVAGGPSCRSLPAPATGQFAESSQSFANDVFGIR
jgi:diguanylate cyclase (GGDEF)-like protein